MIEAEIAGKLGAACERATDRAEDLLTSTVFGFLRYLPVQKGLVAFLRRCRPFPADRSDIKTTEWPDWDRVHACKVSFWPRLGEYGIPDVMVTLEDANGAILGELVVEAKFNSPKSGRAGEDDGEQAIEGVRDPDQLVRYFQGLQAYARPGSHPLGLIYLTAHSVPPRDELAASFDRYPAMRLAWLSWRDASSVAHPQAETSLPAADLARLLAHKYLGYFVGFTARTPAGGFVPPSARLWNRIASLRYFTVKTPRLPQSGHFWRGT
jgi:hypothetical protein